MWLTTIKRLGLNQGICYEKKEKKKYIILCELRT